MSEEPKEARSYFSETNFILVPIYCVPISRRRPVLDAIDTIFIIVGLIRCRIISENFLLIRFKYFVTSSYPVEKLLLRIGL